MPEDEKCVNFTIHDCPKALVERVKAKAALVGKDKDEWVIGLFRRETKKLRAIQEEYKKEESAAHSQEESE